MEYLNLKRLNEIPADSFQTRQPYPWANIEQSLTPEGYERLRATSPSVDGFDKHVGVKRAYGQGPHDRFLLHYRPGLEIAEPWREFLAELQGPVY